MEKLVKLAKIFSDKNRLNIFALILRDDKLCVCEICDTLKLSQPLVSRHLKMMKEAQVLQATQEGKWMLYALTKDIDSALKCWIDETSKHLSALPNLVACNFTHPKRRIQS